MKSNVDKNKVIGFDMDGVILDHTKTKLLVAKKFNLNIKKEQTPSDIIRDCMPHTTYLKFQVALNDNPKFKYLSPTMPGVKAMLAQIVRSKLPYFLISRRKKPVSAIKILKYNGLWPKYFNKQNTFFVLTPEDKNTKAVELGVTHYFDDETRVLDKLVDVKNKFLFDHIGVFKNSGYARVKSWKELSKLIEI